MIFLDLKKAFDTVNRDILLEKLVDHDILLEKLSCYGLRDNGLSLLQSYLSNRSQCCSVNSKILDLWP